MKHLLIVLILFIFTAGCGNGELITEEMAIQKAYSLVQQDCLKHPDYSWHSLQISAYSAEYDEDRHRWLVDIGPNPYYITVWMIDDSPLKIAVPWNTWALAKSGDIEWFKRAYLKHCHYEYRWDSEGGIVLK